MFLPLHRIELIKPFASITSFSDMILRPRFAARCEEIFGAVDVIRCTCVGFDDHRPDKLKFRTVSIEATSSS